MPRLTRAALRSAAIEETEEAAQIPLPSTPKADRTPLGEITLNAEEKPKIVLEVNLSKPEKKTGKSKQAKTRHKKKDDDANKENTPEIVDDDNQSTASSAVEEACEDLMRQDEKGVTEFTSFVSNKYTRVPLTHSTVNHKIQIIDQQPRMPSSKAVRAARKKLSPSPRRAQTPRFDPAVHRTPEQQHMAEARGEADSFIDSIQSRSPVKITNMKPQEEIMFVASPKIDADPFVERATTNGSANSSPRIEDSVAEIDALNEAIESVGKLIPTVIDEPKSPVKSRTLAGQKALKSIPQETVKKPASSVTAKTVRSKPIASSAKKVPIKHSPTKSTTRPATKSSTACLSTSTKPVSLANKPPTPPKSKSPVKSSPTPSSSAESKPVAHRPKSRVSSISKAPFVPTKSSKPPTTSTFTLPGDAISAKLKAQREERLKRETEGKDRENQKENNGGRRPSFKARPVRISSGNVPVVRSTATSRARLSSFTKTTSDIKEGAEPTPTPKKTSNPPKTQAPKPKPRTSTSSTSPTLTSKRISQAPPHRPSLASKTRATPSTTATTPGSMSRKEKEEAAKKARAEAAERGRKASREWAERMKARKMAEKGRKEAEGVEGANREVAVGGA